MNAPGRAGNSGAAAGAKHTVEHLRQFERVHLLLLNDTWRWPRASRAIRGVGFQGARRGWGCLQRGEEGPDFVQDAEELGVLLLGGQIADRDALPGGINLGRYAGNLCLDANEHAVQILTQIYCERIHTREPLTGKEIDNTATIIDVRAEVASLADVNDRTGVTGQSKFDHVGVACDDLCIKHDRSRAADHTPAHRDHLDRRWHEGLVEGKFLIKSNRWGGAIRTKIDQAYRDDGTWLPPYSCE